MSPGKPLFTYYFRLLLLCQKLHRITGFKVVFFNFDGFNFRTLNLYEVDCENQPRVRAIAAVWNFNDGFREDSDS